MQPWDRVLALPQGRENTIHNIIFELFHRYWSLHQVGKVNYAPHKHAYPRPIGTRSWWCWFPLTSPPTNQKNVPELITPSLNHYCKTPHYPPSGDRVLWALALCGPFASQSNKAILFYFTLNSMSERFNLVLGCGGWIWLQTEGSSVECML